jgi:hypothetical protein
MTAVPPLVAEDFACGFCGFAFAECDVATVPERLPELAAELRAFVADLDSDRLRAKPDPAVWSGAEYLCHVRDVMYATTIRLYRVRMEDTPHIEPLFNDLRAARFRYAACDPSMVLDEIDAGVAGCRDEIARVDDWDRTMTRLPGEERTARWLARAAVHETVHHLRDLHNVTR